MTGIPLATFIRNIHPDDRAHVDSAIAAAVRTEQEYNIEYRIVQADDSVRWVNARGRCNHAPDGEPSNFPGVILDITDRKHREEALRHTDKLAAVGQLTSHIAHEINNPLESVVNLLYLIETSAEQSPREAGTYARLAQQELARISQITTQTLLFFKQSKTPTSTGLAELAASVLALYGGRLRNAGIVIEPRIRPSTSLVCYEGEVRQVLNNLVGNAIDAMRTGGHLHLRARPATAPRTSVAGVRITVADTGTGIHPDVLRKIFEPFFTTKGMLGTGLGLSVTSGIITKHSGLLTVRSSRSDARHGTVFSIFLPHLEYLVASAPAPASPQSAAKLAGQNDSDISRQPTSSRPAAPSESSPKPTRPDSPARPWAPRPKPDTTV